MLAEVWYWKNVKYVRGAKPSADEFARDYALMWSGEAPEGKPAVPTLEDLWIELNACPEKYFSQDDVKAKLEPHPHTSASVGDVFALGGKKFICCSIDWEPLGV